MIQVKSKEEAIEWASRCPAADNETIEVRQLLELSEFPPDVQEAVTTQSRARRRLDGPDRSLAMTDAEGGVIGSG